MCPCVSYAEKMFVFPRHGIWFSSSKHNACTADYQNEFAILRLVPVRLCCCCCYVCVLFPNGNIRWITFQVVNQFVWNLIKQGFLHLHDEIISLTNKMMNWGIRIRNEFTYVHMKWIQLLKLSLPLRIVNACGRTHTHISAHPPNATVTLVLFMIPWVGVSTLWRWSKFTLILTQWRNKCFPPTLIIILMMNRKKKRIQWNT